MEAIFKRRSIRSYTSEDVSDAQVEKLLSAAMAAPSAGNEQPWEFVVIRDRKTMNAITSIHPYAAMLKQAPLAICVCGDLHREKYAGYWVQDCSAATENLLIAAADMGLGTCWLGVHPLKDREEGIAKLLGVPEHIVPFAVIAVGHPNENPGPVDRFDPSRIHGDRW